jgi:hypothetical protein
MLFQTCRVIKMAFHPRGSLSEVPAPSSITPLVTKTLTAA